MSDELNPDPTKPIKDGSRLAMKRDPKPKPLSERQYIPKTPIKRRHLSYTKEKKMEVLTYLEHHRVERWDPGTGKNYMRRPVQRDAAAHFKVPQATIARWTKRKDQIEALKGGARRAPKSKKSQAESTPQDASSGPAAPEQSDRTKSPTPSESANQAAESDHENQLSPEDSFFQTESTPLAS
ncbi:hypothetical protein K490DRAFT_52738 [Saccharata proteae CBS 121410]|uniref:Uncharacterized protein n=1 Tax=Saccharata proteae CBS 121410 TaxID=1314787 RepID=A0A9P4I1P8_9PEZI|nr:hypothetical protein K490DRAFT_52738 [Saccharata proteae CBS 121410]